MKSVCILMSTYNGYHYIREQLNSLLLQTGVKIKILVRDDGSTDGTQDILNEYSSLNKLEWYQGNNLGPALSFMDLVKCAPESDYYAFCDQDDIWGTNKLLSAVNKSVKYESTNKPILYFSDVCPVDNNLDIIEYEKLIPKVDLYAECIMNYAFGCTMVFNDKLRNQMINKIPSSLIMHDWWVYLVCLCLGGHVIYDDKSYIMYRQHDQNASGFKESKTKQFKRRMMSVLIKKDKKRSKMLKELFRLYENQINPNETKQLVKQLAYYDVNSRYKLEILKNNIFRSGKKSCDKTFKLSILINRY